VRRRDFNLQLLGLAGAAPLAAALQRGKLDEAAGLFAKQVDAGQLGAATLHARQRSFTFRRSFGEAKTPDAIFLIASIAKPMTATGVMLLADRGKLTLEDPVHKFIPEFAEGDRRLVTVKHLLTHTSGLPDQLPENDELRKGHAPLSKFVEGAIRTPLLFKPGAHTSTRAWESCSPPNCASASPNSLFPSFSTGKSSSPLG
jgi:beta-lactamase class C